MNSAFCIVTTSLGTEDEAETLAAEIVEQRLAACVPVQRVRSLYRWQDTLHREPEWVLHIKTLEARYAALESFILERHSYETPEIIRMPVAGGSAGYLSWVEGGCVPPVQE